MKPQSVELIGCGALAEQVYAPVLAYLEQTGSARVISLVDPSGERVAKLAKTFPSARTAAKLEDLPAAENALAVVATPPNFHAGQTRALLAAGRHVLCEKPLALSVAEVESMIAAAQSAGRLLAAGMMRRFYPAAQALRENLAAGTFGEVKQIDVIEGGKFGWDAASAKFFAPENGGVLFDLGSHVLDLLCHWFGEPLKTESWNDALGGINSNCLLTASWPNNLTARIRLSWDVANLPTGWRIRTTRGECRWNGAADGALVFHPEGGSWELSSLAQPAFSHGEGKNASGWTAAFVHQFANVFGAIRGENPLLAPAADVLPSLRWLEDASRLGKLMPQPWLSEAEQAQASQLAQK